MLSTNIQAPFSLRPNLDSGKYSHITPNFKGGLDAKLTDETATCVVSTPQILVRLEDSHSIRQSSRTERNPKCLAARSASTGVRCGSMRFDADKAQAHL